ncbi:MAG: DUF1549 domain-containing protein [Pirellulaceae bacterium]
MTTNNLFAILSVTFCFTLLAPLSAKEPEPKLPPAAAQTVDFHRDIAPILRGSCLKCHSGEQAKGKLRMETRELMMKGGESGAVVVSGKSGESELIRLVAGLEKERVMPAQGPRLKEEQIGLLRAWIDQGLKWDAGFRFKSVQQMPLEPRKVTLPSFAKGLLPTNPIDLLLRDYIQQNKVEFKEFASDGVFARRVYLDLVGQLPPTEVVEHFTTVKDDPLKRHKLVRQLLDNKKAYAEHWLTFWNDQLRNAYRGTGFIDGGRKPITDWLYKSLYDNKPYDQFVHELISPVPGSEGFTGGITWRGVVNASQRREMQAAQNIGQVFLGTNLKCASCHDSFVNHWKLTDSYGLAAIFADGPLEMHRCDKRTGEMAKVAFIYPQLGSIDAAAPKAERMKQLADLMTGPKNGRLARVIVNRLWAQLMGQGLVEPLDDLDQPAWNQDLLDWLAADLVEHKYDLKHTLELICTSDAYSRPTVGAPKIDESEFVFRGPIVKRMSAEQFVDAVSVLTGTPPGQPAVTLPPVEKGATAEVKLAGKWIWNDANAAKAASGGRVFFRKSFELTELPTRALAVMTCDNEFMLFVNGRKVVEGKEWSSPTAQSLQPYLQKGMNVIAIEATNWPDVENKKGLENKSPNPAGLAFSLAYQLDKSSPWGVLETDETWLAHGKYLVGWGKNDFEPQGWQHAKELGGYEIGPWNIAAKFQSALTTASSTIPGGHVRASLVNDDPLTRALGRPNREQVVTRRDSLATTLQALELTNGTTLDALLKRGAEKWLKAVSDVEGKTHPPTCITRGIYTTALSREPTAAELAASRELLGDKPTKESVEDLLWIVAMLPEFQLVH